jgi:hypothetical protein
MQIASLIARPNNTGYLGGQFILQLARFSLHTELSFSFPAGIIIFAANPAIRRRNSLYVK